jgi:hypothetical protein
LSWYSQGEKCSGKNLRATGKSVGSCRDDAVFAERSKEMAVAGLVFGILGIAVCWWAGPAIGVLIASISTGTSALQGQMEINSTPIWVSGLIIGVVLPIVAVGLSIGGLSKDDKKGVALVGLVLGVLSALLGLIVTVLAGTGSGILGDFVASENPAGETSQLNEYEDMQKTLDDPAFQKQMEEAMKQAQQLKVPPPPPESASGTPPEPASGAPAPGVKAPSSSGVAPPSGPSSQ